MKLVVVFLLCCSAVFGQQLNLRKGEGGLFSLGVRSTLSGFIGSNVLSSGTGFGLGGQFRIQPAKMVNTDWFFDYITENAGDLANRTDYHIGWSVLYYPILKPAAFARPYILAGHCFDYTKLEENANRTNYLERWSSAVQGGIGVHLNLSERLDLSLLGQYMIHLGTDIHEEYENGQVIFHEEKGGTLEGHLLFNASINYKIADLW
jgi:hypothetical protein